MKSDKRDLQIFSKKSYKMWQKKPMKIVTSFTPQSSTLRGENKLHIRYTYIYMFIYLCKYYSFMFICTHTGQFCARRAMCSASKGENILHIACIYIYIFIWLYLYILIYIHVHTQVNFVRRDTCVAWNAATQRERERERCIYIYICIYIYT